MFVCRKIWRALFSCYLRFEIRPFALLPTNLGPVSRGQLSLKTNVMRKILKISFVIA